MKLKLEWALVKFYKVWNEKTTRWKEEKKHKQEQKSFQIALKVGIDGKMLEGNLTIQCLCDAKDNIQQKLINQKQHGISVHKPQN